MLNENDIIWDDKSVQTINPSDIEWDSSESIEPSKNISWGQVGKQALTNIVPDAVNQLRNIYQIVRHPIESAKGIGKLGLGAIEKLIPGEQSHEEVASQVWNQLTEQYGGIENIKKTIAEHPVQVGFDISTIFTTTGGLARLGTKVGLKTVPKIGEIATKAGQIVEPSNVITAPIRAGIKTVIPKSLPERLYIGALKPTVETPTEARKLASFGLNKELTIRYKSWAKVEDEISFFNEQVNNIIQKGAGKGDVINIYDIVQHLDDIKSSYAPFTDRPDLIARQIDHTKQALIDFHNKRSAGKLSPVDVQRLKTTQHKLLESAYGELNASTKKAIQKSLAFGARETLENLYPELKKLNIPEGELIEFNKHLGKAIMAHEKSDYVRNIAFMIKAVIDQPYLKSKLAIWLNRAKKGHPLANPKALEKDLLIQFGRFNALSEQNIQQLQGESTLTPPKETTFKDGGEGGGSVLGSINEATRDLLNFVTKPSGGKVLGIDPTVMQAAMQLGFNNPAVANATMDYLKKMAVENPKTLQYMKLLSPHERLTALYNIVFRLINQEKGVIPIATGK